MHKFQITPYLTVSVIGIYGMDRVIISLFHIHNNYFIITSFSLSTDITVPLKMNPLFKTIGEKCYKMSIFGGTVDERNRKCQ